MRGRRAHSRVRCRAPPMSSRFSRPAVAAFELFFLPWMRRRLRAVRIAGIPESLPVARPIVLVANHVSWWDGFILREVHRAIRPTAPFFTLMSKEELDRIPFLRQLGVLEIDRNSPSSIARAIRFLEARVTRCPDTVVAYFPQGRIWPTHRRPLGFKRGVELVLRRLDAVALPVAIHVEPLTDVAPTVFVSIGQPVGADAGAGLLERCVERELDAVLAFLATHGEEAGERWPTAGTGSLLPRGDSPSLP